MANDIVWFDSAETGAPTLNNAAGSLDAVLYACLVTGFRTITLNSLVVAGGVATATYSAGHGFADKRMVELAGAATSACNGRKFITVTGANTFTFPAPGVADGTISGTITAKRSPLGWSRARNSGNVSIYERTDVTATAMALRVDDSGTGAAAATYARARMVESHTDINTFTNPSPPAGELGGAGVYWNKGPDNTSAKRWVLIGDSRTFYLLAEGASYPASSYGGTPQGLFGFGDAARLDSGDAYCCWIAGAEGTNGMSSDSFGAAQYLGSAVSSASMWWSRASTGIGGSVRGMMSGNSSGSPRRIGGSGPAYPSPVDNGVVLQGFVVASESNTPFTNPLRGVLRGLADPLANMIPSTSAAASLGTPVLDNLIGSDRRFLLVPFNQLGSYGCVAFDVTGPWA